MLRFQPFDGLPLGGDTTVSIAPSSSPAMTAAMMVAITSGNAATFATLSARLPLAMGDGGLLVLLLLVAILLLWMGGDAGQNEVLWAAADPEPQLIFLT